jgi:uncharacterized membrane protein
VRNKTTWHKISRYIFFNFRVFGVFLWFSVFEKTAVDIYIGFYFLNTAISVRHADPGLVYS